MKTGVAIVAAAAGPAAATFGKGGFGFGGKGGFGGGIDAGIGGGIDAGVGGGIDAGIGGGIDAGIGGGIGAGVGLDFGWGGDVGFGKKFCDAPTFPRPGNTKNKCSDKVQGGFDWKDLIPGKFDKYLDFDFKGWTCEEDKDWGKVISGECGKEIEFAPSFGCGKESFSDKFSLKEFEIDVEFDCRLEFHYDMPDGSFCKHSNDCFKGIKNKIKNSQCGGATDVRVVYPEQPEKPKDTCKITIPKIDFDCDDNEPEVPEHDKPEHDKPEHDKPEHDDEDDEEPEHDKPEHDDDEPEDDKPEDDDEDDEEPEETPVSSKILPSPSKTPGETPELPEETLASSTELPEVPTETPEVPEETLASSTELPEVPIETRESSIVSVPTSTASIPNNGTIPTVPVPTESPETIPGATTSASITEMTTSTIFTTSIKTITDCGDDVPDCPADGTKEVTETIAISTTVCPVDDVKPTEAPEDSEDGDVPSNGPKPSTTATSAQLPDEPETPKPTGGADVPELPDLELPCPDVVPKCLNTWLHTVKECKNNLDVACFCPDKDFVEETYACLYAHGETDDIIAEAVEFFQGICAPFIPKNPGIVTGIETITSCITVTGTPTVTSVPYTTIVVETTVTEPCVSNGVTLSESSTTKVISTDVVVPDMPIPTTNVPGPTANPSYVPTASDELPVPGPTEAPEVPADGSELPPAPTDAPEAPGDGPGAPPAVTSFQTTRPGTIGAPVPTTTLPVPTAGAAHVKAGMGVGMAVMVAAALM